MAPRKRPPREGLTEGCGPYQTRLTPKQRRQRNEKLARKFGWELNPEPGGSGIRIDGVITPRWPDPPATFQAPNYERVLGHDNPFLPEDPLHRRWEDARREAARKAALLREKCLRDAVQGTDELIERLVTYWSGLFDIRAEAWMVVPMLAGDYSEIMTGNAEVILSSVRVQRLPVGEELIDKLTAALQERHAHWMAQAYTQERADVARATQIRAREAQPIPPAANRAAAAPNVEPGPAGSTPDSDSIGVVEFVAEGELFTHHGSIPSDKTAAFLKTRETRRAVGFRGTAESLKRLRKTLQEAARRHGCTAQTKFLENGDLVARMGPPRT